MVLTNTQIADNIINLLQKAKENDAFDDNTSPLKLFNKMVKAAMKGQTKINIKVSNKAPSAYNLFVKEKMSQVKAENPDMPGAEIFKKIGALWTEQNPKKPKEPKEPKEKLALPIQPKESTKKATKKATKKEVDDKVDDKDDDVKVDIKTDKSDKKAKSPKTGKK